MQAIPVGFSGLGNLAGASFETGIGLGGSLAGAFSALFGMLFFIPRFRIPHRSVPDEAWRESLPPAEKWFLRRHDSLLRGLRKETTFASLVLKVRRLVNLSLSHLFLPKFPSSPYSRPHGVCLFPKADPD